MVPDTPVILFLVLLVALLAADGAFYRFASLPAKRRFHLAWQIGTFALFLASLTVLGDGLYNPRLILPAAILFTFVDLVRIRFCPDCGATLRSWRPEPCRKCQERKMGKKPGWFSPQSG